MSEKDKTDQSLEQSAGAPDGADGPAGEAGARKAPAKSKEDRLAEALRANLRRRKSAAKARKDG
ncbi:hypothetical protein FMN50_22280 [Rhodobacterales bacterium]|nr:hypothetical protein FMN50_22280 [Rhodobacterales bacterium]